MLAVTARRTYVVSPARLHGEALMPYIVRLLGSDDLVLLDKVAPDVFDGPVDPSLAERFLADPRHHLAVAIHEGTVVGFASGVDYIHPDKPPELWINEVGVSEAHQRQGLGRSLLEVLFGAGRAAGCQAAWVLTDALNQPALGLYSSVGGTTPTGQPVMMEFHLASASGRPAEQNREETD